MQKAKPITEEQDGEITRMIKPFLRQAVVEESGFVHHPEIHIRDAQIGPPETEQKEGDDDARDDAGERSGPIVDEDQLFEFASGLSEVFL
jgi:hypothetical protein